MTRHISPTGASLRLTILSPDEDPARRQYEEQMKRLEDEKARMEELSIFYNENLEDEKIHFFEKLRLKIKKALFNRPGK